MRVLCQVKLDLTVQLLILGSSSDSQTSFFLLFSSMKDRTKKAEDLALERVKKIFFERVMLEMLTDVSNEFSKCVLSTTTSLGSEGLLEGLQAAWVYDDP